MKVIFLDIDGVLNRTVMNRPQFEPSCVEQLNRVLHATEANVVLSSSWRHWCIGDADKGIPPHMSLEGFSYMLNTHGLWGLRLIDHIGPDTDTRGALIRKWLHGNRHRDVNRYVVLDDCDHGISEESLPFVQTSSHDGLTVDAANDVIRLLNRE